MFVIPWVALATPLVATPVAPTGVRTAGIDCAETARLPVDVPGGYDSVRVVTSAGQAGAAVVVSVAGADRGVSLTAPAGGPSTLTVTPSGGGPVLVAIEPDLDVAVGACVERIDLLRGGEVVARVAP